MKKGDFGSPKSNEQRIERWFRIKNLINWENAEKGKVDLEVLERAKFWGVSFQDLSFILLFYTLEQKCIIFRDSR